MQNEYLRVFRALSDQKRVQILENLCNGEQCACDLLQALDISQSTLSHHMKILCESGLVKGEREGVWIYYSINGEGCDHAGKLIDSIIGKNMKRWLICFSLVGKVLSPFQTESDRIPRVSQCSCHTIPRKKAAREAGRI